MALKKKSYVIMSLCYQIFQYYYEPFNCYTIVYYAPIAVFYSLRRCCPLQCMSAEEDVLNVLILYLFIDNSYIINISVLACFIHC